MEKQVNITVTEEQAKLISHALNFYSRIGIGQFRFILDHPTWYEKIYNLCKLIKQPEVGDRTSQGEILEIKDNKALINGSVKNGVWCKDKKWIKLKDVELTIDWKKFHTLQKEVGKKLVECRNMMCGSTYKNEISEREVWVDTDEEDDFGHYENEKYVLQVENHLNNKDEVYGINCSYGIYSREVDESCRVAYDIHQVIRHEFWKNTPNKSLVTVDSSKHLTTKDSNQIKCKIING